MTHFDGVVFFFFKKKPLWGNYSSQLLDACLGFADLQIGGICGDLSHSVNVHIQAKDQQNYINGALSCKPLSLTPPRQSPDKVNGYLRLSRGMVGGDGLGKSTGGAPAAVPTGAGVPPDAPPAARSVDSSVTEPSMGSNS